MAQTNQTDYTYVASGSPNFLVPFPYLSTSEVEVTVDGAPAGVIWTALNSVQLTPTPAVGAVVRVRRNTDARAVRNDFSAGAPFSPRNINENNEQLLYAVEETVNETAGTAADALETAQAAQAVAQAASDKVDAATILSAEQLRQDLANATDPAKGAGLVGYSGGTVESALDAIGGVVESQASSDFLGHLPLGGFSESTIGRAIRESSLERYGAFNEINSWRANTGYIAGRKVNILGDSISFGAGAGTTQGNSIPENAWVRILGNALNNKYGVFSYGFVSPYTTNGTGTELHTVSTSGVWSELAGAGAGHTPAGYARESSAANATLTFNQNVESSHFKIWYDGSVTGSFEVSINSGASIVDTIVTTGAGVGLEVSATYACSPLAAGNTNYRIRVISGTVRITGISYLNDSTGLEYQLNNFSRDGRAGRHVTENVIKEMCRGCQALVWALAANDRNVTGSELLDYKQRIDWLIEYANQYGTRLIIPDFLFVNPDSHPIRQELMRLAASVPNSTYIPFPNMLHISGQVQSAAYITNTIKFTYDGVHLSQIGHRVVAAAIGECLGVHANKLDNLTNNARWRPLQLINGAVNVVLTYAGVSKFRFNNKALELFLNINTVLSGTVVANIAGLPGKLLAGQYRSSPDASGRTVLVAISAAGAVTIYADAGSSGAPTAIGLQVRIPFATLAGFA